jgi:hypothetical protein
MMTRRPDLAYTSIKLLQSNTCLHKLHYHGLKHALKFLYNSHNDGLYFWRTAPRPELPKGPLPRINGNCNDILLNNRLQFYALMAHAFADSDWATSMKTHQSFGGICIRLAGGTITYKCCFQPTVAGLSTEAEFMAACDTGKMILFVRNILWDLNIPQDAATLLYKDNNGCTAMGSVQKPAPRTQHIDIKSYFSLCEWVECNLMLFDRIDTLINMANHLTKALQPILFHRYINFLLRHVPPMYSPIYKSTIGSLMNQQMGIDLFVPKKITPPLTAAAARVYTPLKDDYHNNPWLIIIGHG